MANIYFRLIKIPQAKTKQNKTWIAKRDKQFTKVASLGNFSTNGCVWVCLLCPYKDH